MPLEPLLEPLPRSMSHVRTFDLSMKKISVVIPSYNEEKKRQVDV